MQESFIKRHPWPAPDDRIARLILTEARMPFRRAAPERGHQAAASAAARTSSRRCRGPADASESTPLQCLPAPRLAQGGKRRPRRAAGPPNLPPPVAGPCAQHLRATRATLRLPPPRVGGPAPTRGGSGPRLGLPDRAGSALRSGLGLPGSAGTSECSCSAQCDRRRSPLHCTRRPRPNPVRALPSRARLGAAAAARPGGVVSGATGDCAIA